jgi:hypothetical protein
MTDAIQRQIRDEIERLHVFFVDWFAGQLEDTDEVFDAALGDFLAEDFLYCFPGGARVGKEPLLASLADAHGTNPNFRIAVRDVEVRASGGDLVVATYTEWQRNALFSTPSDNARFSTAIFRRSDDVSSRYLWQHIHETWLPQEERAAGNFDF